MAMQVARVWQDDDAPDLSATLKAIDARLARAEEWGRTLRVLRDDMAAGEGEDMAYDQNAGMPGDGSRYQ